MYRNMYKCQYHFASPEIARMSSMVLMWRPLSSLISDLRKHTATGYPSLCHFTYTFELLTAKTLKLSVWRQVLLHKDAICQFTYVPVNSVSGLRVCKFDNHFSVAHVNIPALSVTFVNVCTGQRYSRSLSLVQ